VSSKQSNFVFGSNRNKPKLNLFRLIFGLFRKTKKHFFWFVSLFQTCIKTTKTNRTLSKQTETNNQKNLQKTFSIRGSSKQLIFFLGLNRNKQKLKLFRLFFGLFFCQNFFWFVTVFQTGVETTETNRTYGMGN
jgi:hypothetical protein